MTRRSPPLTRDQIASLKLQARIADLEKENAWLRSMSGAGFARGSIKTPPRLVWPVKPEQEEML